MPSFNPYAPAAYDKNETYTKNEVYNKSEVYSKTEAVAKADVVNDLTSGGTTVPLSAEMGKELNSNIAKKVNLVKSGYSNNDTIALERNKYYLLVGGNEYWAVNVFLVYDNGWRKKGADSDSKISFSGDNVVIAQYVRYMLMSN